MALVWERIELSQSETLVALALADHADDDGQCWPSIDRIAEKARLKRRATQNVIQRLEQVGLIDVERRIGRRNTNTYRFHVEQKGASDAPLNDLEKVHLTTEKVHPGTKKVHRRTKKRAADAPITNGKGASDDRKGAAANAPEPKSKKEEKTPLPPGLDETAWEEWLTYRTKLRKPIKPVSMPAAQRKLAGFGADQAAVVEQSIANGWQGLFALKDNGNGTGRTNGKQSPSRYEQSNEKLRQWAAERGIDPAEI